MSNAHITLPRIETIHFQQLCNCLFFDWTKQNPPLDPISIWVSSILNDIGMYLLVSLLLEIEIIEEVKRIPIDFKTDYKAVYLIYIVGTVKSRKRAMQRSD